MLEFSNLRRVMEAETISKNAASPKSQMSKTNNKMKHLLLQVILSFFVIFLSISCSSVLSVQRQAEINENINEHYKDGWKILSSDIENEYNIVIRSTFNGKKDFRNYFESISEEGTGKDNMVRVRLVNAVDERGKLSHITMYKLKD